MRPGVVKRQLAAATGAERERFVLLSCGFGRKFLLPGIHGPQLSQPVPREGRRGMVRKQAAAHQRFLFRAGAKEAPQTANASASVNYEGSGHAADARQGASYNVLAPKSGPARAFVNKSGPARAFSPWLFHRVQPASARLCRVLPAPEPLAP